MSAEQRVFLRVRLPGEQFRLYQLQPHVKLGNISRSLKHPGNLFFQGRKIDETATPEQLGLRCGVENVVEILFVPQDPQASLMQSSSFTDVPAAPSSDSAGLDAPAPRYTTVDIQRLLRALQDRDSKDSAASQPSTILDDSHRRSALPIEGTTSAVIGDAQPSSGLSGTPASTPYNPRGNLLRNTEQQSPLTAAIGDSTAHRPPRLQHFVDRPPRKALPTERRHADTTTPHTVWPNQEGMAATAGAVMDSHVVHSPNLQGTKRRDNSEASFLALHASPVLASESRDRSAVVKHEKMVGTEGTGDQGSFEGEGTRRNGSEQATDSRRMLLLEETIEALKLELIEERVRRQQLEVSLRRLEERCPDLTIETPEKQHYRIMQELREQRRTRNVHV